MYYISHNGNLYSCQVVEFTVKGWSTVKQISGSSSLTLRVSPQLFCPLEVGGRGGCTHTTYISTHTQSCTHSLSAIILASASRRLISRAA